MPTPPKPFSVIASEKRSHRTKAELEIRQKAEEQLASGVKMRVRQEVKTDEVAYKEYKRIAKLLRNIQKDDDLFGACINRYCQMYAECRDFEVKREAFFRRAQRLEERESELIEKGDMTVKEYYGLLSMLQSQVVALDKQIQTKRKAMFDYEKENIMTVAAGLRSIPKKEPANEDPVKALLGG